MFYDGLFDQYKQIVDATCGGAYMIKGEDEIYQFYEVIGENFINHASFFIYNR